MTGFDLTGRSILVTGAAGGIGAVTARVLASQGASLVLTDRTACDATLAGLGEAAPRARAIVLDLLAEDAPARLTAEAGPVDAAILGAGIYRPVDWDAEDWEGVASATLDINLMAAMRVARSLVPAMAARGGGRVVLIGSIVAATGGSFPGVGPHYAASKGGLHSFVRWLAARYGPQGVLVNGIAPGVTDTAMVAVHDLGTTLARHPLGRAARPDEIAWPIAFLCSPAASFVSGAILDVNGGANMRP